MMTWTELFATLAMVAILSPFLWAVHILSGEGARALTQRDRRS